ncbi:MAG: sensor histidine kinase [Chloroflexota bacterium]
MSPAADSPESLASISRELAATVADGQAQLAQLQRQQRELGTLVRQIEGELRLAGTRQAEIEDRIKAVVASPGGLNAAEVAEAYAALADATTRHSLMQVQLDSLRQRGQWLAEHRGQLAQFVDLFERLDGLPLGVAEPPPPEAPNPAPAAPLATRELSRQVVAAREDLSDWLAKELRDGQVQTFSNLILQAEIVRRLIVRDPAKAEAEARSLKTSLTEAMAAARVLVSGLHPPALREVGFQASLRRYVEEVAGRLGARVQLRLPGRNIALPSETELALFRLVQESLRLAQLALVVAEVEVQLSVDEAKAELSVHAAGRPSPRAETGTGWNALTTYAQAIGGELQAEGPDGRGLTVRVVVPLAVAE